MIYNTDFITDFVFIKENKIYPCNIILVPGGSRPQLAEKAAELYRQGFAKYILFSGYKNPKIAEYSSEAEYLKSIAVNLGVPVDSIICEHKATNTFENAEFSLNILKKESINTDRIIIICKAFHSRRVLLTYQYLFPKSTDFLIIPITDNRGLNRENWTSNDEFIKTVMTEVEKVGKYFSDKIAQKD